MLEPLMPCVMRASREMLPEALTHLFRCGAAVLRVEAEAVAYRIDFQHLNFDGCETLLQMSRDAERGTFTAAIRVIGPTAEALASADTHPKDGDAQQAPLVSGAVPSEASADAQTQSPND